MLELCYGGRVLKLRFASLDDMSAWWSDLSATQELLARLDAEEGHAPVDDDDRDDLEPTATPATPDTPRRARNEFHVDLARGAFELASASRYGAAAVLFRSSHVLNRHVHGSGAAFDLRTDG